MLLDARDLRAALRGDDGEVRVLDGVSLGVDAGEIVDVVGPSGSGKTTLLRALARLLPEATGELALGGVPASKIEPGVWRSRVALLPQVPAIGEGTIRDNLTLPWTLRVRKGEVPPGDDRLLELLGLVHLDLSLDRDASRLSVGQRARVALVRTLATAPEVLLLDEPDAALDSESMEAVTEATREFCHRGGGVVRVRHRDSDGLARRRLRLADGALQVVES